MIEKIELKESKFGQDEIFLIINITTNQITYLKNNIIIKDEKYYIDTKYLINFVKENITYWDNEYIDNNIIDGIKSELNIYTDKEVLKYKFTNKFPYNYNEFITKLKELVNIIC